MTVEFNLDVSELEALERAIRGLPGEIKTKAIARAMRRMRDMAKTRVVKRTAERVKLSQKQVRELTTASFNAGGNTIEIIEKSGWIGLYKLGATQTRLGVRVRLRGSYRHAFIAAVKAGKKGATHTGVWRRVPGEMMESNDKKEAIRELFGPNPANDVTSNPEVYLNTLAEIIQDHLAPRVLHEIDRLLPR